MLQSVPRTVVGHARLASQLLLRVADATVVAVVGADGSFAGNAVVVGEALALTRLSVADALVGALYGRMGVVGTLHVADPSVASV